jgi:hypothetical protein
MPVNCAIVTIAQATSRQPLGSALGRDLGFEGIEFGLTAQTEAVLEDCRSGIAVRIVPRAVHAGGLWLAMHRKDTADALLWWQPLPIKLRGTAACRRRETNSLDRADFRKASTAKNKLVSGGLAFGLRLQLGIPFHRDSIPSMRGFGMASGCANEYADS